MQKFIPNVYSAFLQKVDAKGFNPTECWVWLGATKGNGYGNVRVSQKNMSAHRRAHELFIGPVPDGIDVCHTCDNRGCVNPDHLFLGNRHANMQDMKSKGRGAGPNRKQLREHTVQEIRARLEAGHSPRKIANQMNIHYGTVTAIRAGRSYGWVK